MVDLSTEHLLSLPEAASRLPGRPHISTLHRWRQRGVRGVKLETLLLGGRRYTSREALKRFAAATTAAGSVDRSTEERSTDERQQAIVRAERELDLAGI